MHKHRKLAKFVHRFGKKEFLLLFHLINCIFVTYSLGVCYANGTGVSQDYAEAVKWYRKSAEQGMAYAQNDLGVCYADGTGVSQDHVEAVKWYRISAEQGCAVAQFNLGECYEYGNGVLKDIPEAIKWYTKAAEQGDEESAERIKVLKQEGEQ